MSGTPSITVLLSTFNGEMYLDELLDSLGRQIGVDVSVFIRDDGSTDGTKDILTKYERHSNFQIVHGSNIGYIKSFWWLLSHASGSQYYAFADQDDCWLPDKLCNSVSTIELERGAALCTGNVIPMSADGVLLGIHPFEQHGPLSLFQSLQYSILPGCTFVFNEPARKMAALYHGHMESHDWALYSIITALGTVRYCEKPGVLYRLHDGNTVGAPSKLKIVLTRAKRLVDSEGGGRSKFASDIIETFGDILDRDSLDVLQLFANSNDSIKARLNLAFYPQNSDPIFALNALLGRV